MSQYVAGTGTLTWDDYRGKKVTRPINYSLDFRERGGEPGQALLIVAANTHLSINDLIRLLECFGIERSRSWIQRRRWLFQHPDAVNSHHPTNRDGQDARAIEIMAENPSLSLRGLVMLLKEHGINRHKDWVRQHRCDALSVRRSPI